MFGDKGKSVGVIGLGIIGSRVAQNLRDAKYHVYVWNRTPQAEPNFVASVAEMASLTETIQIFVKDGPAVLEVLDAMLPKLTPKHLVLVHATIDPEEMIKASRLLEKTGAGLVDAPFTGSREAAAAGELSYYVAGDPKDIQRAKSLLGVSGRSTTFLGRLGNASIAKVATNMISAATVQALSEALAVLRSAGLRGDRLVDALAVNACQSGLTQLKLPSILEGQYDPHFSVANMLKDAEIALTMAERQGIDCPTLTSAADAMRLAEADGKGDLDYSVLAAAYPGPSNDHDVDL